MVGHGLRYIKRCREARQGPQYYVCGKAGFKVKRGGKRQGKGHNVCVCGRARFKVKKRWRETKRPLCVCVAR